MWAVNNPNTTAATTFTLPLSIAHSKLETNKTALKES